MAAPAPPSPIVQKATAVVEWSDHTTKPRLSRYLVGANPSSVLFTMLCNEQQYTAALFIRVSLRLGQQQMTEDEKEEYLYIMIEPSDIILLTQDSARNLAENSPRDIAVFGSPTTCLRLLLRRPVTIFGSSKLALPLHSKHSAEPLRALGLLTQQTLFAIHLEQSRVLDMEALQRICQAAMEGRLTQHQVYMKLLSQRHHATVIEPHNLPRTGSSKRRRGDQDDDGEDDNDDDNHRIATPSPPSYTATQALSPPLAATQSKSPEKKRLRQLQEREQAQEWEQDSTDMGDTMPLTRTVVGVWARFLAQQKAQMGEFLTQRQAQIDKFFTQRQAQIDQTFVRIDAQMQEMEVRITERLEGRIGDEIQDCERHVGALVRDNTITLRHELEEVVEDSVERSLDFGDNSWEDLKDEIRQACLDELKDDLEGGLVTITLPR